MDDLEILSLLRKNCRIKLKEISNMTNIPVTTIFDKIKRFTFIKKYTILFDNTFLNYRKKIYMIYTKDIEEIKSGNINDIFRTTGTYNYIIECIFKNIKEEIKFETELYYKVTEYKEFPIIETLEKEKFLCTHQKQKYDYYLF